MPTDSRALAELPTPEQINKLLPPAEMLRYNVLIRRWESRGTPEAEWVVTGSNPLSCPIHHGIRSGLLGGLSPEAAVIGNRGAWEEVLDLMRERRKHNPIDELIDFGIMPEDITPPPEEDRKFYLPWLTALQRGYLDDPPEQPLSLIEAEQVMLPSNCRRYESLLFRRTNITGFSRSDIKTLDKRHNRVLSNNLGIPEITRILYSLDQPPIYQLMITVPPINSADAWLGAWLIYQDDPHYRVAVSTPLHEYLGEAFEELMPLVFEQGHRMTISETLATILHGDRAKSPQVAVEYAAGDGKILVDSIATQLRAAGWYQRKVMYGNNRRTRWVNPELEEGTDQEQ